MFLERIAQHAQQNPAKAALRVKRDGAYRVWTYGEAWDCILRAAGYLKERGVADGERVALFADNSPEWVLAYLGIVAVGGVVVPLDAQYGRRELEGLLRFAQCRVALFGPSTAERLEESIANAPVEETACIEGDSPLFQAEPLAAPAPRDEDETMALLFTSGTTGDPKGVCLSRKNVASNIEGILGLFEIFDSDNLLSILPLHHCYALTVTGLVPLAAGAQITYCLSLRGPDIVETVQETGVSALVGVPKLFEGFNRAIMEKVEHGSLAKRAAFGGMCWVSRNIRRLTGLNSGKLLFRSVHRVFGPSMRVLASGGAKLDPAITSRFLDLGLVLVEGYGLTETAPVLTFNPLTRPKPGSVGIPLENVEIRIDDPDAEGVGEILACGPNVMQGYLDRPEDTEAVMKDGWFRTGDLGYMDKDGYLFITGRAKEVIVLASGKNIYPDEVEKHYERSPFVKELCVMPEEEADGRVRHLRAVVVPDFDEIRRQGATDTHVAVRASFQRLSAELPSYMRVNQIKLVANELPRTRLGKLKRSEIHQMDFDEVGRGDEAELSPEDRELLESPRAQNLLARIRELSGHEGPIAPSDHLELDLGLDSLGRVELDVVLEKDFGVSIGQEEALSISTVGELLQRLLGSEEADQGGGKARAGWGELLRERAAPPLSELFDLERGRCKRAGVHALRLAIRRFSERAFALDVRGLGNLPRARPFLLCPSHASFMDSFLVASVLPDEVQERLFFLGAEIHFRRLVARLVGKMGQVILVSGGDTLLPSLRRTAEAIDLGRSVCIFPEGSITRDGFLQRPRLGAGIIACHKGAPIVPVLMRGTYDTLSYTHPAPRFVPVGMTFGPPIEPPRKQDFGNEDYVGVMEEWTRAIARMRAEDDASGSPTAGRSPWIRRM